jgi:biotin synthase
MAGQIRVSIGTAITLGLLEGKQDAEPTTAYLMTYTQDKCVANCGFCPQARNSQSKTELLSRISWPVFSSHVVITQIANAARNDTIRRVCIQTLNYPEAFQDLIQFIRALKSHASVSVSVSCQPLSAQNLWSLAQAGVDRVGIALDAATEALFNKIKGKAAGGPYNWQEEFVLLRAAVGIFGEGNVSTHIIFGLGETEKDVAQLLQRCVDMGVVPGLFAFTPIRGTALAQKKQPALKAYRRIQLARHLIVNNQVRFEDMRFNSAGELVDFGIGKNILQSAVESGKPFMTSGCPDCNRPFYNEKPSGPLYNHPKLPAEEQISQFKQELKIFIE